VAYFRVKSLIKGLLPWSDPKAYKAYWQETRLKLDCLRIFNGRFKTYWRGKRQWQRCLEQFTRI